MKTTEFTEVKTIDYLERMNNSKNGNPRWRVGFSDGTSATTAPDSAVSYEIGNPEYQGKPVQVTFSGKREQIVSVKVAE